MSMRRSKGKEKALLTAPLSPRDGFFFFMVIRHVNRLFLYGIFSQSVGDVLDSEGTDWGVEAASYRM